jgi:uncharacterized membrane protein (DUF4010 family)
MPPLPPLSDVLGDLGVALGLGLLVGLQRESTSSQLAGLRTFPLVTLLGAVCALLSAGGSGWLLAAGLVGVAAATAMGNAARLREPVPDAGITTEVALLLMYALGAYAVLGHRAVAVVIGGTVAVLLHFKAVLHGAVQRLGEGELRAVMQFVLLALVVLPVLPDATFGPYAVFNPREMWLMAVLIVGLSLAGYVALKFFGERAGIVAGGLLGGLISSTATTVSWSRATRGRPETARTAALVIVVASTIVYGRVLAEIATVSRPFLPVAAPPILGLAGAMALAAAVLWRRSRGEPPVTADGQQPASLKTAFTFAALYGIVLLTVAIVNDRFGTRGLYAVSAISGLTDVDAITLSVSRLVGSGQIGPELGARLVVVGVLSNLAFKGAIAALLGDRRLRRSVAIVFATQLATGAVLLIASL